MKSINLSKFNKLAIFLCIITVSIFIICSTGAMANKADENTVDDIVLQYINSMNQQDFETVLNMAKSKEVGYDAKIRNYNIMNSYCEKPEQMKEMASKSLNDVVSSQYEFINLNFGQNSWDNVTYKIVKRECPSKKEEFINTKTNKVITENEAEIITDKYWRNFAEERGIGYAEFLKIKEYSGEFNEEENMNILIAKELGFRAPVKINLVDEYDYYSVYLTFNGQSETENGEDSFRITIDNKNGSYELTNGLRWSVPISPENMNDI